MNENGNKVNLNPEQIRKLFNGQYVNSNVWLQNIWRGVPVLKPPTDMWAYQQLIYETRPDVLIETGTAYGGSALFFADVMEAMGHGRVISIDIEPIGQPPHDRILYITGNSLNASPENLGLDGSERCMVSLDSDHSAEHVIKELELFSDYVSDGCYLVCEDTHISSLRPELMPGPGEALDKFMAEGGAKEFARDLRNEPALTFTPGGWLRRVARVPKRQRSVEEIKGDVAASVGLPGGGCSRCGAITSRLLPDGRPLCATCFDRVQGNEMWQLVCLKCESTFNSEPEREQHERECEANPVDKQPSHADTKTA